jgi:hypothetical protein
MPVARALLIKCDDPSCQRAPQVIPEVNGHPMLPIGWTEDVPCIVTNPNLPAKQPKFFCPEHSQPTTK